MPQDLYQKIRLRLDQFPQGFPKTPSGVELDILKDLYSPEEAEIMLHLKPYPELAKTIAARAGMDRKKSAEMLYNMSRRGLILRIKRSKTSTRKIYYFLAPWMIGIWEFQVNRLTPQKIIRYERYYREGMVPEAVKRNISGMRVIPIEKEIRDDSQIEPFEQVSAIIEQHTRFAVSECICRKERRMQGHDCGKLREACLSLGFGADYYIENGWAREITKTEAKQVLIRAEEDGLIHFSSNHKGNKDFICNCCGCCCKVLGYINTYNNPKPISKANYYAVLDEKACTVCEICLVRCQVNAIRIDNRKVQINSNRCIGCGLCASACPSNAVSLQRKAPHDLSPTYADDMEFMQALSQDTNKPYPFE